MMGMKKFKLNFQVEKIFQVESVTLMSEPAGTTDALNMGSSPLIDLSALITAYLHFQLEISS